MSKRQESHFWQSGVAMGVLLVATSTIGILASALLLIDRMRLLEDASYVPMCSIDDVFNCGSVMTTEQASAFGIPNPIIGMVGFSVVLVIGVGSLSGASYQRWFWLGLQGGVTFAILFVHWLMYQTLFVIEALCPYCMAVWAVTAPLFWYVMLRNLGYLQLHRGTALRRVGNVVSNYHTSLLAGWYLMVLLLAYWVFWF